MEGQPRPNIRCLSEGGDELINRRVALQSIGIAVLLGLIGIGIYHYAIKWRPCGDWAVRCDTSDVTCCKPPFTCVLVHAGHGQPDHHYCCTEAKVIGADSDGRITGCGN